MSRVDEPQVVEHAGEAGEVTARSVRRLERVFVAGRAMPFVLIALALVPMVVSIVHVLVDHRFALNGDDSLIELRVRDVGGSHTPLVGSYGRYGFNQPGPLLFYLYAIPYRVLGSTFAGIQVGSLLVGMASVVAIAVVAWRRGGTLLLVWALFLTLVLARYIPWHLTDPWEPYAVILPLVALVFLTFDAVAGDRWALPFVLAVASFVAGTQPVTSPVAVVLAVTAIVGVVLRTRGRRDGGWAGPVGVSAVVVAILWAPPIVDAIVHDPSNVQRLWRFLQAPHHVLGFGDGYRVLALQFGVPAPWSGGRTVLSVFEATLDLAAAPAVPIALLVVVAGVIAAGRRRKRAAWLGVVALLAFGAGVLAMSRLVGPLYVWIPQWTRTVGMTCWVAGVWCLFTALPDSVRARLRRPLLAACVAALLAVVSANAVVSATERPPRDPLEAAVMRLAVPAVATARAAGGPVLVRSEAHAGTPLGGDEVGLEVLALALEHRGVRVVVDSRLVDRFGVGRARPQPVREELLIVPASQPVPAGYRLVATADPLTPRQRADRDRISEELAPLLRNSSLRQIAERARRDPRFGARLRRLKKIPDVPQLALIVRPRAHS